MREAKDNELGEPGLPVLAVDPGRVRCGVAVVACSGQTLYQAVVPSEEVLAEVGRLVGRYTPKVVLVGKGTGVKPILDSLEPLLGDIPIVVVDEARTSEAARKLFVAENPARGWQKLLPAALRTPDRPYDDYAARILAERWIKANCSLLQ